MKCVISKSLRLLDISGNPMMEKIEDDPKEKEAMLSLLETFNSIYNLEGCSVHSYDSDVEYALRINHAGRRIVECGRGDRPLPLSVTVNDRTC